MLRRRPPAAAHAARDGSDASTKAQVPPCRARHANVTVSTAMLWAGFTRMTQRKKQRGYECRSAAHSAADNAEEAGRLQQSRAAALLARHSRSALQQCRAMRTYCSGASRMIMVCAMALAAQHLADERANGAIPGAWKGDSEGDRASKAAIGTGRR